MNRTQTIALLACCTVLLTAGCRKTGSGNQATPASARNPLNLSSDDRALQQKLQPVIECINRTFAHFQELRPAYREEINNIVHPSSSNEFHMPSVVFVSFKVEPYEQNAQFSRDCASGLNKAADMAPKLSSVDDAARDAAAALLALIQPGVDMDAYLDQKAYLNDHFDRGRQLDATVTPLLDRVVSDADRLQDAVQQQEAVLRRHELDAIEHRYGRNLTWHTRRCMIEARALNDNLVSLARSNKLNAATAAEAQKPLQTAYDEGAAYASAHPDAGKATPNGAVPMWFKINDSLSRELGDSNELRQALSDPTTSREIVADRVKSINSEFNSMVSTYNLMQSNNLTTD